VDLLLLVHHAKTSGASEIIVVIPHFPFARQDRKDQTRSNISAAWFARMLDSSGATTVITMDLHNPATQGVFSGLNLPCHNLFFSIVWKKFFAGHFNKETHAVIAPDAGAFKQAQNFAIAFDLNVATIFKRRDVTAENAVSTFGLSGAKFVRGKTGIILDDMLDTGGTICAAAAELEKTGVSELIIIVTHGILSGPAINRLNNCKQIKKVYVTDTVPQEDNVRKMFRKLEVISVTPLFAEVLRRYFSGESISELFN
jgi:ribose-phosphate pyrophosphokinase